MSVTSIEKPEQRARASSSQFNLGAMFSRPRPGPKPSVPTCRGRKGMSRLNPRQQIADCSMLSGLGVLKSPAAC